MILNNSEPCKPAVNPHQFHTIVMSGDVDNLVPVVVVPKSSGIPFTEYSLENMQRAGIPLRPLNMSTVTAGDTHEIIENFANAVESSKPASDE